MNKKIKIIDILFFTAYTIFLIYNMGSNIGFVSNMHNFFEGVVYLIIMCIFLIQLKKCRVRDLIIIFIIMIVSLISYSICKNGNIMLTILFIIVGKRIDFDKFIKYDYKIKISLIIIIVFFCKLGLSQDVVMIREDGLIRHSLGFSHPNGLGLYLFCVCADIVYLNYSKIKIKNLIILTISFFICHFICDSRAATLGIIIMLITRLFLKKEKIEISKIFYYLPIILTFLSFALSYAFMKNPSNNLLMLINTITSGRLKCASQFIDSYNLNLFGNYFEYYGQWKTRGQYLTVLDNAYVHLYLQYGLILATIVLLAITLSINNAIKSNNKKIMCCIIAFLFFGLMGQGVFLISKNAMVLFVGKLLNEKEE